MGKVFRRTKTHLDSLWFRKAPLENYPEMLFFWHAHWVSQRRADPEEDLTSFIFDHKFTFGKRELLLNDTQQDTRMEPNFKTLPSDWKAKAMTTKRSPENKSWLVLFVH